MSKLKKNRKKVIGCIVVAIMLLLVGNWLYKNRKVHFADEKMRQVICLELGKDKDSQNITYKELEKIEELKIGPLGEYETLIDVIKFKNLKELRVNMEVTYRDAYYELFQKTEDGKMYYPLLDEEKITKVQEELEKIFKEQKKIESFGFTNVNETCNIRNFNFLNNAKNLKELTICFGNVSDYSFLRKCPNLEKVDFDQSNIEEADALLELRYVKWLLLKDTPLAENEKEMNRLKKAFPEAKIIVD